MPAFLLVSINVRKRGPLQFFDPSLIEQTMAFVLRSMAHAMLGTVYYCKCALYSSLYTLNQLAACGFAGTYTAYTLLGPVVLLYTCEPCCRLCCNVQCHTHITPVAPSCTKLRR